LCNIGNGQRASGWYDTWDSVCPLGDFITPRLINAAGFHLDTKVVEIASGGSWNWPSAWVDRFPVLNEVLDRSFNTNNDTYLWKLDPGTYAFSASMVWNTIRIHSPNVPWCKLVWYSQCIPKHAFMLWLVIWKKIHTQDKIREWGIANGGNMNLMCCLLCYSGLETHSHLFFECKYTSHVWGSICSTIGYNNAPMVWEDIVTWLTPSAASQSIANIVRKLCWAAVVYHVWQERNSRFHSSGVKPPEVIIASVLENVRYKLLGLKFKRRDHVRTFLDRLGMHGSMIFDDGG
jgi:hypothetical protein